MTNEQNAIQLEGYLVELNAAIATAKEYIEPTMVEPEGLMRMAGVTVPYPEYQQLEGLVDLATRLQSDISTLKNEVNIVGGF